jgi:hypothetical protein
MRVGILLLADSAEALNGKLYTLGAGWNMLRFPELPAPWSFSIALGLDVPWDSTNRRHALALRIDDPDGETLGDEFTMEVEAGRPPGAVQGQDQRIVFALGTQLEFERPGPHAVIVSVGDQEIGRSRFYVVEVESEGFPAPGF